jgi:large subunit ribosomal protein L25
MSKITLTATTGRETGSPASRRLRAEGSIPAVVYGHGMTPLSVAIDRRDLRLALSGPSGTNAVVHLTVDGSEKPTIVKELQRHPVKRTVTHVDFLVVSMTEAIDVEVPIVIEGEAKEVLGAGGSVDQVLHSLAISTTPNDLPGSITVDVTDLQPGGVIRVGDLALPAGVVARSDADEAVVVGTGPAGEEPEGAEEEGEGAEASAEGAEAGGGDAAAADDAE